MTQINLREKLAREVDRIPDEDLAGIYEIIHQYRQRRQEHRTLQPIMAFAGAWQNMPHEVFDDFLSEINQRRRKAGKRRRGD